MKISNFMSRNFETILASDTTKAAARKMHDLHVGTLPVMDNDKLVGMITDRDITCRVIATGHDAVMTKVNEIMVNKVITCFEDQDILEAADVMKNNHIRRLVILHRDDSLAGVLSVRDIASGSYKLASEILVASTTPH